MTIVQNHYDGAGESWMSCGGLQTDGDPSWGIPRHDTANHGLTFTYRGNLTYTTGLQGTRCSAYRITGVPYKGTGPSGVVNIATSQETFYAVPTVLTPNSNNNLATSLGYTNYFEVRWMNGPNGTNWTKEFDNFGRVTRVHLPDGAATNYTYTYNPNTVTATMGTWTKTTLDGFGRTTKVEKGHGTTTVSVVDTEYAPCACSPLGKVKRVSQPRAPGAAAVWTTFTYDGSGRTLTATAPDGSVTTYLYQGNTTKVTDPAGKWKKQTVDAMGNLVTVTEPNPASGADWLTNYTYNAVNQLTGVSMPRGGYTQTRSFTYVGLDMVSETNPETGTKTYQYDANHRVTSRTDAKGQRTDYTYDVYGRITTIRRYSWNDATPRVLVEMVNQRVDYLYDTTVLPGFSQNAWGRLTGVLFHNEHASTTEQFGYFYSYNQAGRIVKQRATVYRNDDYQLELDASYTWDNEGRMTSMTGPRGNGEDPAPVYNYQYDAMKTLSGMTGSATAYATYGVAGEMTSFNGDTRTYNNLFQLTRIQGGGIDIEYRYTAGQNNGRIASEKDWITGEEVTYTYDAVNRLAKAETTDNTWGQAFGYDGFGNLTSKTVTKGSAPVLSTTIDPATNMPVGSPAPSFVPAYWSSSSDVEDRKLKTWGEVPGYIANYFLSYDPSGKRMWRGVGEVYTGCEFYFYGIRGERLATYGCDWSNWGYLKERNVYFAGKPLTLRGVSVKTDRLGSVRLWGAERLNYYPYGEDRGTSANRREKFGTYFRDDDGTDYADQRYYGPGKGRFDTADPAGRAAANPSDPGTWNLFSYVNSDPTNYSDPSGLSFWGDVWHAITGAVSAVGGALGVGPLNGPGGTNSGNSRDTAEAAADNDSNGPSSTLVDNVPCVYSVLYFGGPPSDQLDPDAVCVLTAVYKATSTPVTVLAIGSLVIPAVFTAAGAIAGYGGTAVLGSSEWVQIGGVVNGQVLNVPTIVWTELGPLGQQAAMRGFLNDALAKGLGIVFTENPALAAAGSGVAYEYKYLIDLGYKIAQSGTSWIVVP